MTTPMIIRANDSSGDWLWGQSEGDMLEGPPAVAQNVQTRCLCFKNDCFWNLPFGIDWFNLLGSTNPTAENGILLQARQVIGTSWGIVAINMIDVVEVNLTRSIALLYNLSSIYSTQQTGSTISGSVSPI